MVGAARSRVRSKPDIAIVAHARETVNALESYLERAGFVPQSTRFLGHPREMVHASCRVLVFFPDDFPAAAADAALVDLAPLPIHTLLVTGSRHETEAGPALSLRLRAEVEVPRGPRHGDRSAHRAAVAQLEQRRATALAQLLERPAGRQKIVRFPENHPLARSWLWMGSP